MNFTDHFRWEFGNDGSCDLVCKHCNTVVKHYSSSTMVRIGDCKNVWSMHNIVGRSGTTALEHIKSKHEQMLSI